MIWKVFYNIKIVLYFLRKKILWIYKKKMCYFLLFYISSSCNGTKTHLTLRHYHTMPSRLLVLPAQMLRSLQVHRRLVFALVWFQFKFLIKLLLNNVIVCKLFIIVQLSIKINYHNIIFHCVFISIYYIQLLFFVLEYL